MPTMHYSMKYLTSYLPFYLPWQILQTEPWPNKNVEDSDFSTDQSPEVSSDDASSDDISSDGSV